MGDAQENLLGKKFTPLYAVNGRPAKPVRLMVGLLLLKQMKNLSDAQVLEHWIQNPYFQAFCGMQTFQWKLPCDSSDINYFRTRIGEEGFQEIFNVSVSLHGESAKEEDADGFAVYLRIYFVNANAYGTRWVASAAVVIDTTVQEKNSTFPTDSKLSVKIIVKCRCIAKKEGLSLHPGRSGPGSFTQELSKLLRALRFENNKKTAHKRSRARKRVRTMAGVLVREISRKLSRAAYAKYKNDFDLFEKVLQQKKNTKHKIYSLHEPQTVCIAKGKRHKKYEFGAKAGIVMTKTSAIIVGVKSFLGNPYDGHTLDALLVTPSGTSQKCNT